LRLLVEHLGLTKPATVGVDVNIGARLNAALARIEAADALALADAMEALVGPANHSLLQDVMEIERISLGPVCDRRPRPQYLARCPN
jgi:hypothetical protein